MPALTRPLTSLALLTTLGVAAAGAQASPASRGGALVAAPHVATGPAAVRIQTLTWTEIQVPSRLVAAAAAPAAAARPSPRLWFTLTWQPAPLSHSSEGPTSVAMEPPPCTVMRLVSVPCD